MRKFYSILGLILALPFMMEAQESEGVGSSFCVDGVAYNVIEGSDNEVEVTYLGEYIPYIGEVNLPSHVTYAGTDYRVTAIGDYAFTGCDELTGVTIAEGITKIKLNAFGNCPALTHLGIPSTVEEIDIDAFSRSRNIEFVMVNNPYFMLEDGAFFDSDKTALYWFPTSNSGEYIMPQTVEVMANRVFSGSGISAITLSSSLKAIPVYAFAGTSISSLDIPEGIEEIREYGLGGMDYLSEIHLPSTLKTIGENAFIEDAKLYEIIIPDGVENMDTGVFDGCQNLRKVVLPDSLTYLPGHLFRYCLNLSDITLPSHLEVISSYSFLGCYSLKSIHLPESLKYIGEGAFYGCESLTHIDLGNVEEIGEAAFVNIPLESVDLPSSLRIIGAQAFQSNPNFTKITLPSSLEYLGNAAFGYCFNLKEYAIESGNKHFSVEEGVLYNNDKTILEACPAGREGVFNINADVREIGESAFAGCTQLTKINLPDGIVKIGADAFYSCESLVEIDIPESVTEIGESAFTNCLSIKELVLPGINRIQTMLAGGCENLETITLNEGAESIDYYAFYYCTSLKQIALPEGLKTIGNYAFYYDYMLDSVTLPASLEYIDYAAFQYCYMSSVTCLAITPPALYETQASRMYPFDSDTFAGTLYVPEESVELYKSTPIWNNFAEIKGLPSNKVENLPSETDIITVYTLQGVKVIDQGVYDDLTILPAGVYIVNGKKVMLSR